MLRQRPTGVRRRGRAARAPKSGGAREQLAAFKARIADLEAQIGAQDMLRSATATARLNTLLAISSALLVTRDIEAILDQLVSAAPALFPGASAALLYLLDEHGRLALRASGGAALPERAPLPGQGMAGRAFLAPRAMLLAGPELELALDDLGAENSASPALMISHWPPASVLLAPLRGEGQRIGALVLYGGTQAHLFLPRDLPFVQTLADLTAAAIIENRQRAQAAALQRDLARTRSQHAEARQQLSAAQAQLLQSAKLAAVGELAASVAHEINNPLYAARNSLYLIEQDLPPGSSQLAFLAIAQEELSRIARIITRMRDFYRPSQVELEQTAINDIVEETIELVQTHLRHGQVIASADLAAGLPLISAHPDQVRQVLLNLLLNACDAMPGGGEIHVTTSLQPATEQSSAGIVIRVSDTGVGIAPEHMQHMFEPFYTTKPQGTGLGLAISAHIVTQHGGALTVDSTPGEGATFTITLPARETP